MDREISEELGVADMSELSDWLGLPESDGYEERQQRYLELEAKHTTKLRMPLGNLALDTTGSVVHLPRTR